MGKGNQVNTGKNYVKNLKFIETEQFSLLYIVLSLRNVSCGVSVTIMKMTWDSSF